MDEEVRELTGVRMLVSDHGMEWCEASVIGKVSDNDYPYITTSGTTWRKCKPLPKPWEVPPEGYRLVTDEETVKYGHMKIHHAYFVDHSQVWEKIAATSHGFAKGYGFKAYAVPIGLTFEPRPVKVTIGGVSGEISAESARELQRMLKEGVK